MSNRFINIGGKMKRWLGKIIVRDFGRVSYARGLYNILKLYEKYVPRYEKIKLRKGKRLRWT